VTAGPWLHLSSQRQRGRRQVRDLPLGCTCPLDVPEGSVSRRRASGVLICVAPAFWICGRRGRLPSGVGNPHRLGWMPVGVVRPLRSARLLVEILRDITDRYGELTIGASGAALNNLDYYYYRLTAPPRREPLGRAGHRPECGSGPHRGTGPVHPSEWPLPPRPTAGPGGLPADLQRDGTLVDRAGLSCEGIELVPETAASTGSDPEVRLGGCLCGKIRFAVTGSVDDPHVCRCEHCAKRSGAPFMWWVGFPMAGLTWIGECGEPTWYDTYPGKTARGFCAGCGSHIAARDYGDDTIIGILATALDDYATDSALAPTNLNRVAESAPWLAQCDTRPAVAG